MFVIFAISLLVTLSHASFPLPQCPPTGSITLQDPNSCKRFLICINGNQVSQNCAAGLEFDIVVGNCNEKELAKCNPCAANPPNTLHFILDDNYCDKYIMCIGATRNDFVCQAGFHFNPKINACDLPQNANCPHTPTPPTGPTPTPTITPPTNPGNIEAECDLDRNFELIASVKDCSRYLICACGHLNAQNCAPGLVYDVIKKRCDTRQNGAICLKDNPVKCPPTGVQDIAHPNDSRHFYRCSNGLAILRACPAGTLFNTRTNRCEIDCDTPGRSQSFLLQISDTSSNESNSNESNSNESNSNGEIWTWW